MIKYFGKRVLFAILALFVILIFVYTMVYTFAENPVLKTIQNLSKLTEKEKQDLLREAGFNKPVLISFAHYIKGIFQGDWGKVWNSALINRGSIPQIFFKPLRYSIVISLPAFFISVILGVLLGVLSGYKRGKIIDSSINGFVLIFIALPSFIIAPIFIKIGNYIGLPHKIFSFDEEGVSVATKILSLINPILVITLGSLAAYTVYTRNQVITVLTSNYVLIAKTKGLSNTQIFFKYVLRNISIPLATMIIPYYIYLLSGSIIVEIYWQLDEGTSQILAQSFPNGEIYLIMFSTLFFTTLSLMTDIVVDISYVVLDPRIKYAEDSKNNFKLWTKAYFYRKKLLKELEIVNSSQGGNNE